nr:putative ribonuclease H-like domain-containing protein [Tanacetum cinerariifolium]
MRVNHKNFSNSRRNFAPTVVLTKSRIVPISTARQSSSRAAAPVSTASPINTAAPKPIVNVTKTRQNAFQKTHSLSRRESSTKPLAEAVNTACYVRNKVLVTKPHNKTPYELLIGRAPIISFMRPFGCPVTILNTLNHLGKFNGKADEGFLVGYSINSKDFRVYNSITKKVEENCRFKIHYDAGQEGKEKVSAQEYILLPVLNTSSDVPSSNEEVVFSPKDDAGKKLTVKLTYVERGKIDDLGCLDQQIKSTYDSENTNSTNSFNTASLDVNTASDKDGTFERTYGEWNFSTPITVNAAGYSFSHLAALDDFSKMPNLEDIGIFDDAYDNRDEGAEADYNNLEIVEPKKKQERSERDCVRIEAIRLLLAYASFMDFTVFQMNVKSAFLYGTIEEEVYVSQPPGFVDPKFPDRVYKVEKALYGLHQAPRAWYETLSTYLLDNGFRRGIIDKTLFIKIIKNVILLVQVVKSASTPMETHKPLLNDAAGTDVDVHLYRSMIGSLMYLTSSKPNIMFATKIHVDNESAICVVKNPVYHSKTKHIKISSKTVKFVKQIHVIVDGKAVVISESLVRSDLIFDDEDGNVTPLFNNMLVQNQAPKGEGLAIPPEPQPTPSISKPPATPNEPPLTEGHTSGSGEDRLEENIKLMDTIPTPHDSPLTGGYTPRCDEGRITLADLMETCTTLSKKESQLKQKRSSAVIHSSDEEGPSMHIKDSPKQGRIIKEMDKDKNINLEEAEAQDDSDQEVEELKLYMRIILEEDIPIEAIPLAIKPPMIIEYKIVKEGKISTYHITRVDGSTRRYTSMINLLKNINREDLETLWKLVKDKYGNTRLEEGYERVLWGDLKVMFEPDMESEVWRKLKGHEVTVWKLFSSCGVHFVRFKNLHIFLLVDKVYPLTPATINMMLERKLQAVQWNEMCYQLLKLIMK